MKFGQMKAEVSKARGDARSATEKVGSELKRHIKKSEDDAEVRAWTRRTPSQMEGAHS